MWWVAQLLTCALIAARSASAGYPEISLAGTNESCDGPQGDSFSGVSGTTGALTFDVTIAGVPGVPGEPFSLLLHYDSSLDDASTYGSLLGIDVRLEHHTPDAANIRGAEIQITDGGQPPPCGGNRIAWGITTNGPLPADLGPETCEPFMSPGDLAVESLQPTLLAAYNQSPGGVCTFGTHAGAPRRQVRLSFPIRIGGGNRNSSRPMPGCSCPASDDFAITPGVRRIFPAVSVDLGTPGSTQNARCNDGFPTFFRGLSDVARLGPNWSHNFADRLTFHTSGGTEYVVLESYTGKWVMFERSLTPIPPAGRELQQVPEGNVVPELNVDDPAYGVVPIAVES
jgi:hypothetical protein